MFSPTCWRRGGPSRSPRRCARRRWSRIARTPVSPASSKVFSASPTTAEFLTALRACWAALWTTNARRSMAQHDLDPAGTAMAVLVQPLIAARASGGGLSETAEGQMLLVRHLGPRLGHRAGRSGAGPHRAQHATVSCARNEAGRKHHREACDHRRGGPMPQAVPADLVERAVPRSAARPPRSAA